MFAIKNTCVSILSICLITSTIEERVLLDHNYIQQIEQLIGVTLNLLFNSLGLKNFSETTKIKQYVSVHDYFVSLTLQDYNDLQDVANLTRVEETNVSKLITILNEILNEDSVYNLLGIIMGTENNWGVDKENDLEKLKFLNRFYKEQYVEPTNFTNEIENKMDDDSDTKDSFPASNMTITRGNQTKENVTNLSDENEFWHEEYASGRRLYQGVYTNIKTYPFMASIEMFSKFHCGGAIIQSDLILTAASCLQLAWNNRYYRENPTFIKVRVGSTFFEYGGDVIEILEIFFYPDYNPKNLHHNIAVLRLTRKIIFKHRKVKKIKIDKQTNALPMNIDKITVVGWGLSSHNLVQKPFDHKLKYSHLQMYMLEECQDIYSEKYVTKEQNFCAGYISKGSGACNRDVGGPGVVVGKLAGIISFGAPVCGTPDAPTVFVKVGYYSDWIEEIMEQDTNTVNARTTTKFPQQTWPFTIQGKEKVEIPIQRDRHVDVSIFKKLLKTMFESEEIEDYIEAKSHSKATPQTTVPISRNRPPERPFDLGLSSNTPTHPMVYSISIPSQLNELDPQSNSDNSDLDIASVSSENDVKELSIPILPNTTSALPSNIKRPKESLIPPTSPQTTPKDVKLPFDYQDANHGVNKSNPINANVLPDPDEELIERIKNALESPKPLEIVKNVTQEDAEDAEQNSTLTSLSPQPNAKNETDDDLENAILTLVYMTSNESDNVVRAFDDDLFYDSETVQDKISELAPLFNLTFNEKAILPKNFVFKANNGNITGNPRLTKLLTESPFYEYK